MKPSIFCAALLFFASSVQAQHPHQPVANSSSTASYWYGQGGWGGGWGSGWGSNSFGSRGRSVAYEPPREYSIGYAKNDGPFVPSTYMNYEDALALGRQQLADADKAARGEAGASLGDTARALRADKVPTLKLQLRVLQDNSGNLEVCNLNGNNCHRP
jgi:hypothetical protein